MKIRIYIRPKLSFLTHKGHFQMPSLYEPDLGHSIDHCRLLHPVLDLAVLVSPHENGHEEFSHSPQTLMPNLNS